MQHSTLPWWLAQSAILPDKAYAFPNSNSLISFVVFDLEERVHRCHKICSVISPSSWIPVLRQVGSKYASWVTATSFCWPECCWRVASFWPLLQGSPTCIIQLAMSKISEKGPIQNVLYDCKEECTSPVVVVISSNLVPSNMLAAIRYGAHWWAWLIGMFWYVTCLSSCLSTRKSLSKSELLTQDPARQFLTLLRCLGLRQSCCWWYGNDLCEDSNLQDVEMVNCYTVHMNMAIVSMYEQSLFVWKRIWT